MRIAKFRESVLDCYQYREVLYNILSQDLKVKYRRTFFGYVWSLLNPILQLAVLSVVFSPIMRNGLNFKVGMKDYTLYLFSGLIAWIFFQQTLSSASVCLLENEHFIKKIYLPKLLFPLSKLLLRGIDFLFSLIALSLLGWIVGFPFHSTVLALPLAVLIFWVFTWGLAILVAIATTFFRDIQYLLTVFLQLLYFATPILYPISVMPNSYLPFVQMNPLYGQIALFQKLLYFGEMPTPQEWTIAGGGALIAFVCGMVAMNILEEELVFRM